MFEKILIANRGEIACRVARTCARLGIGTAAVYSDADAGALHVSLCDEAYRLGKAPARDSYLRGDLILAAAHASGAQAIHPGYGFLSENADFAESCRDAGVVFIGPPPAAIRAMGSKSEAKALMAEAGVPLIPGYHGDEQDSAALAREAQRIGFPVLIKASAGGGGKGMRVVDTATDFDEALAGAKREAVAAFGDDKVLIERYLTDPRHVEVQIFADGHGNVVHLFERDCSLQRRHQKIMEEAPAPGLSEALRREMGAAATAAARGVGYVGAGTVEFLLDGDGRFYFMEMNTRLQVEHPVTEMITGLDLVEWQLAVASGEPLPLKQRQIGRKGHAFEARLYAEDPDRGFLPSSGPIDHLHMPQETAHVRLECGVRERDEITVHYDPMIAKLVVWDRSRAEALRRLRGALREVRLVGPATNLAFLGQVARHSEFADAKLSTRFIDRHRDQLLPPTTPASDAALATATLHELRRTEAADRGRAAAGGDPFAPWHFSNGWRLNSDNHHVMRFQDGDREVDVVAHYRSDHYRLELPGGTVTARATGDENQLQVTLNGHRFPATVIRRGGAHHVFLPAGAWRLVLHDPHAAEMDADAAGGRLTAPMPGRIVNLMVKPGDRVDAGDPLLVLEAMKMEYTVTAPAEALVEAIHYAVGDPVEEGAELLVLGRT